MKSSSRNALLKGFYKMIGWKKKKSQFIHEHPLELLINQTLNQTSSCAGCKLPPQSGSIYCCTTCPFFLHQKCFETPKQINHPFHKAHPLMFLRKPAYSIGNFLCGACDKYGTGFSYHCKSCQFDLHILCALAPLSLTHASHNHKLDLTFESPSEGFRCDICTGSEGFGFKKWFYRCDLCGFDAHFSCVEGDPQTHRREYYFSVVRDYELRALREDEFYNQDLEKFFLVPTQNDTLEKNELIATFINCLLQLQYEGNAYNLYENLRFLLMVLGDATIFLYHDEHGPVQIDPLEEVEVAANLAGSSVHSFIYATDRLEQYFGVFLERMDLLKGNILKFSNQLPVLNAKYSNKNSSLFIVNSLIIDLENLLKRDDSVLIDDVKNQIGALHQYLALSWSILVSPPHDSEIQHVIIQITEVAFEAEYLIVSFLAGDAPLWYFSKRLSHVSHKINLIATRLQNIDIKTLKLEHNFNSSQQLQLQANNINSKVDNIIVGFDEIFEKILDKLVGGPKQLKIIFIFGMPGLGKTTLAKKLYNTTNVQLKFDRHSMCVVSQMCQMERLLTDIVSSIDSIDKNTIMDMDVESLVVKIHKSLWNRRYLIVIDDVWDMKALDTLFRYFPDEKNGSRVLITSRNKDMAPPNSIIYELPFLSNEQCWELLEKKVFKNNPYPTQLREVGKEIASKCRGLPLAVVVIAGILSAMDRESSAWKEVGEKVLSYSSCGENDPVMKIMELSYNHLPQHLKPCFLYFGVFAEDEKISAKKLMQFWIAEGFISEDKESGESSDHLAKKYLKQLIGKSLVMVAERSSVGGVKYCIIHDRLRDLCLKISEEENFLKILDDDNESVYEKSHRIVNPRLLSYFPYVRSIHCVLDRNLQFFVANMKLVRVLSTRSYYVFRWIGVEYLVNLRYLVIHGKWLSSSIGSLVNLEYLTVINNVINGENIHFLILKMNKLRYLHFTGGWVIFDNDCNPSQTNNLQYISSVLIRNLKDEEMLKCSPHLRRLKCYCKPLYVEENGAMKYRYLDLLFFTHLESLTMESLTMESLNWRMGEVETIQFPSQIKRLNLKRLHLSSESMSVIGGLPNLQVLKLYYINFDVEAWETRDGEFQQLTFLKLHDPRNLRQWNVVSSQHFPKLQRLHLYNCYALEVPCEIGEIPTLELIEVMWCDEATEESVWNIEQQKRDMGNEEFRVIRSLNR